MPLIPVPPRTLSWRRSWRSISPARLRRNVQCTGFSALGFDRLVGAARAGASRRELAAAITVELLEQVGALGTAERVAARLRDYEEAGADCLALVPCTAEDPAGRATLNALSRKGES